MLVIGYYTRGTAYAEEAERLRLSLVRAGMPHELTAIPPTADWDEAVAQKVHVIRWQRERNAGGLLYIDVDAVVHQDCSPYFLALEGRADFAAHWLAGRGAGGLELGTTGEHMLSGTLWFGDTMGARRLLDLWIGRNRMHCAAGDRTGQGQRNLAEVLPVAAAAGVRIERLPGRYCYVFRRPECYAADEPRIIEHTLASRENRGPSAGHLDPARRARLAVLDGGPEPAVGPDLAGPRIITHKHVHKREA